MSTNTNKDGVEALRWKRSEEGNTETHCGRYKIDGLHLGSTRPKAFNVWFCENGSKRQRVSAYADTLRDAKRAAERHHSAHERTYEASVRAVRAVIADHVKRNNLFDDAGRPLVDAASLAHDLRCSGALLPTTTTHADAIVRLCTR